MQVGSLVVIKKLPKGKTQKGVVWLPIDDESTPYVIRNILQCNGGMGVYLEEGVLGYFGELEIGLDIRYVREVQSPMEVSAQQIVEESIYELVPMNR